MKNRSKTGVRLFVILVLAGTVALLGVQRHSISALRAEQLDLSTESQETDRLMGGNKMAEGVGDESAEVQRLRAENADLLKLRNEVGQLHGRLAELAKPSPAGQIPTNRTESPGAWLASAERVKMDTMADEGFASPRATLETYFWALKHGNIPQAAACMLAPTNSAGTLLSRQAMDPKTAEIMQAMTGYDIRGQSALSQDEIVLDVQLLTPTNGPDLEMHFKSMDGVWKIAQ